MRHLHRLPAWLALPLLTFGGTIAHAQHNPHQEQTPFPFRCPRAGICLEPSESNNVIGGVRHGDEEIRFHALYRPKSDNANDSPYCVIITDTELNVVASSGDGATCSEIDDTDESIFGTKPTTKEDAKRNQNVDDVTFGCIEHLVAAEMRPDNAEAWGAVQALAQRWIKEQNAAENKNDEQGDGKSRSDKDTSGRDND